MITSNKVWPNCVYKDAFKQLDNNTKHDTKYRVLPFGAISRICKLKLNRKEVKTTESTHDKLTIKQNVVNHANLKLIPLQANEGEIYATHYRWELLIHAH